MQINEEKVRLKRTDSSIRINIGSTYNNELGIQQQIENLTHNTSNDLINPHVDGEVSRFKFKEEELIHTYKFYFGLNTNTGLINAGFTSIELASRALNVENSFFILDFYDTYNSSIQRKLFTTYITKIDNTAHVSEYMIGVLPINYGQLIPVDQIKYLYIPKWFINENSGNTTQNIYLKFSFYNAKIGKTSTFYNNANTSINTSEKYYLTCTLDLLNKRWFVPNSLNKISTFNELITSQEFLDRINNTFETTNVIRQIYPTGDTYNYKTNKYIILTGATIQ